MKGRKRSSRSLVRRSGNEVLEDAKWEARDEGVATSNGCVEWMTKGVQTDPDIALDDLKCTSGAQVYEDCITGEMAPVPTRNAQHAFESRLDDLVESLGRCNVGNRKEEPRVFEETPSREADANIILSNQSGRLGSNTSGEMIPYNTMETLHITLRRFLMNYPLVERFLFCVQSQVNIPLEERPVYPTFMSFVVTMQLLGSVADSATHFTCDGNLYLRVRMKFNNLTRDAQQVVEKYLLKLERAVQSEKDVSNALGDYIFCNVELLARQKNNCGAPSETIAPECTINSLKKNENFEVVIQSAKFMTSI